MKKKNIKLYSTENCPFCFTLKQFLKDSNVEFEEIDINQNGQDREDLLEKLEKQGLRGSVPILDIDGQMIVGFDRDKICKLLNI